MFSRFPGDSRRYQGRHVDLVGGVTPPSRLRPIRRRSPQLAVRRVDSFG